MSNMVVRTNVFALNAHRNLKNVGVDQQRASQRLSSGYRINSAADDAAGLAISESMRAQIRGLDQASRNTQDGQALIQTAEGGMQEIQNMIQRIRELTVQAANDTNTQYNRSEHIALEIQNLLLEIDDMANRVEYNGMTLLNGDFANVGAPLAERVTAVEEAITSVVGLAGTISRVDDLLAAVLTARINDEANLGAVASITAGDPTITTQQMFNLAIVLSGREYFSETATGVGNVEWAVANTVHIAAARSIVTDALVSAGHEAESIAALIGGPGYAAPPNSGTVGDEHFNDVANILRTLRNELRESLGTGNFGEGGLRFQVGANENQLMWTSIRDMRILGERFGTRGSSATHGSAGAGQEGPINHDAVGSLGDAMEVFINNWYQAFNVPHGETTEIHTWDIQNFPAGFDDTEATGAQALSALIESIEAGLQFTSLARAELGAVANRLEYTSRSLDISSENLSDAESRVRNADMAREMMAFTMANVLQQASVSMLAQANQLPNNLLQLLR